MQMCKLCLQTLQQKTSLQLFPTKFANVQTKLLSFKSANRAAVRQNLQAMFAKKQCKTKFADLHTKLCNMLNICLHIVTPWLGIV